MQLHCTALHCTGGHMYMYVTTAFLLHVSRMHTHVYECKEICLSCTCTCTQYMCIMQRKAYMNVCIYMYRHIWKDIHLSLKYQQRSLVIETQHAHHWLAAYYVNSIKLCVCVYVYGVRRWAEKATHSWPKYSTNVAWIERAHVIHSGRCDSNDSSWLWQLSKS